MENISNGMDKLLKKLRELQSITPDNNFKNRTRVLVLAAKQTQKIFLPHFWESFRYSIALSFGTLIILVGLGGFSYFHFSNLSPLMAGGLNGKSLAAEAATAESAIKIAEASYFKNTADAFAVAIDAIDDNTNHINNTVLQRELQNMDIEPSSSQEIDDLLNEIVL